MQFALMLLLAQSFVYTPAIADTGELRARWVYTSGANDQVDDAQIAGEKPERSMVFLEKRMGEHWRPAGVYWGNLTRIKQVDIWGPADNLYVPSVNFTTPLMRLVLASPPSERVHYPGDQLQLASKFSIVYTTPSGKMQNMDVSLNYGTYNSPASSNTPYGDVEVNCGGSMCMKYDYRATDNLNVILQKNGQSVLRIDEPAPSEVVNVFKFSVAPIRYMALIENKVSDGVFRSTYSLVYGAKRNGEKGSVLSTVPQNLPDGSVEYNTFLGRLKIDANQNARWFSRTTSAGHEGFSLENLTPSPKLLTELGIKESPLNIKGPCNVAHYITFN